MTKDRSAVTQDDCINMFSKIGIEGSGPTLQIGLTYSLSKMTIVDEMEDNDRYNKMKKCEFNEFLCRMAWLIYNEDEDQPLIRRLEKLLKQLFSGVLKGKELLIPNFDDGIDSESDCDDDTVNSIIVKLSQNKSDEAFLKAAFDMFDSDGGGSIDNDELINLLNGEEISQFCSKAAIAEVLEEVDDGDGEIDFEEFKKMIMMAKERDNRD